VASSTEERIYRNNRAFREANEKIRAVSADYEDPVDPIPFLCECADERCSAIVKLAPDEYRSIRNDPRQYFTASGHEVREEPVAEVVAQGGKYVVVRKAPLVQ
jgi:hypothetical protein